MHVAPANESELTQMGELLKEFEGATLYGDKGYSYKENDNLLKKRKIKNCLMCKAARNRPLTRGQKLFNKMISKHRYRVEAVSKIFFQQNHSTR
jgi:transposase, IS5 family